MADSENKKKGLLSKLLMSVLLPVAIALLASGTAPWWWSAIFPPPETETKTISQGATETEQRTANRAAYREIPIRQLLNKIDRRDANRGPLTTVGTAPQAIAFNLLGRTLLLEGEDPSSLPLESFTNYSVILLTNEGGGDDSIGGQRYRLEFEKVDKEHWQLVWAGSQQQCRRSATPNEWTTAPCP